jgi:hypothetical protein
MTHGEDFEAMAKNARRRRMRDAAIEFYIDAVDAFESERDLLGGAHAGRHLAVLLLEVGRITEARTYMASVMAAYDGKGTIARLEWANTLRVIALLDEAECKPLTAELNWMEVRDLYAAEGITEGVAEANQHLIALRVD